MASFVVDSHNPRCPQHLVYWRQPLSSNARLCCGDRLPPTYFAMSTVLGQGPKCPASRRATLVVGHAEPPQHMWVSWWLGVYSFGARWTCGRLTKRKGPDTLEAKSKREAKLWLFRSINVNNKLYINPSQSRLEEKISSISYPKGDRYVCRRTQFLSPSAASKMSS